MEKIKSDTNKKQIKVVIQTADGKYLAPGSVDTLPLKWHKDGITGCIMNQAQFYEWTYEDGVISTADGQAWDTYKDDTDYIILWRRINRGNTQHFQFVNGHMCFSNKLLQIEPSQPARLVDAKGTELTMTELPEKVASEISFVTYNMLVAHKRLERNLESIPLRLRSWHDVSGIRRNLLKEAVRGRDLMTLVEVTPEMLDYVTPPTHQYVYCPRKEDIWGIAIVYKSTRFKEIIRLCEELKPNTVQVLISLLLKDNVSGKSICVTALHLKAGYEDTESRRVREIQIAIEKTQNWLTDKTLDLGQIAHVVAGDLNSDRLAYKSRVKEWLVAQGFKDVFEGYNDSKFWTYNYWHRSIFDYVFIRGPLSALELFIPVSERQSPNEKQGSDHMPVYCNLTIL